MELSGAQKIVKFFSSESKFQKIMEESMNWKFTCSCGKESNIWEIGGVRAGAKGKPSVMIRCPHCGKVAMQNLYQRG